MHKEFGFVQIYVGTGAGNHVASLAALGHGVMMGESGAKVCVIQFADNNPLFGDHLDPRLYGVEVLRPTTGNVRHAVAESIFAREALAIARSLLEQDTYDLIVLHELLTAVSKNTILVGDALSLVRARPPYMTIVITGTDLPPELADAADMITEIAVTERQPGFFCQN